MLIDTSGFLCVAVPREEHHKEAMHLLRNAKTKLTTSYVLAEFVPLAHKRGLHRQEALKFINSIQESNEISIIYVDKKLHKAGVKLLERRLDKSWSLCDALSMVLMEQYNITNVLTTDHHFEQAGFRRLLK